MKSSSIKPKGRRGRPKRLREDEIYGEIDVNQNVKKNKTEELDESYDQLKLFEERLKDAIKTGIDLFHNRISLSAISFKERLTYMIILKKIMSTIEWKLKRLISNKLQMECLARRAIESPKERKDMLTIMEKFVDYKLMSFPGKSRHLKAESIAKHYQCELKCYGVTQDMLSAKINDLIKTIEITEGPLPKIQKNPKKIINVLKVKRKVCRLCGSKENLIYNINHRKNNIRFKEEVEYFCRVNISDNDNLPHLVCKGCKDHIENFSKFAIKIRNFQTKLDEDAEHFVEAKKFIKTEPLDLDNEEEVTNSGNKDTDDFIDESSQEYTEYSTNDVEVGLNCIYPSDNHVPSNDLSSSELQDNIPLIENEIIQNLSHETVLDRSDHELNLISSSEVSTSTPKTPCPPSKTSNRCPKECKIILEKLPIKYVPSDGEESQEELEEVTNTRKERKTHPTRPRSPSFL